MTTSMDPKRWVRAVAVLLAVALIGGVVVALTAIAGQRDPAPTSVAGGPTQGDLDVLAAELSSGDQRRVLASLADIPVEQAEEAFASLGTLKAVAFDASTLRYDGPTQAALVDASLTAADGSTREERVVLVEREGRWLIYSTLQQPGATAIQTP